MEYEVFSVEEAVNLRLPMARRYLDEDFNPEGICLLYEVKDENYRFIAADGVPPEDACFRLKFSWVAEELAQAYTKGYELGFDNGYEEGEWRERMVPKF